MKKYFISVGEPSGDLHAAPVIEELLLRDPSASIRAIAGPLMRKNPISTVVPMEELQVMGFIDVFLALPRLIRIFRKVKTEILTTSPDAVLLVDYPGFHLRLAKSLRKAGYKGKIIQYISPSVWAHGTKRIKTLEKYVDHLLCIFPFELESFSQSSLRVSYVGNPLVERMSRHHYNAHWKEHCGVDPKKPILALFPGSRPAEIDKHLPTMLEAVKNWDGQVAVSGELRGAHSHPQVKVIPREFTYELMADCTAAIAKSGTVTLELALHHKPTIVIYRTGRLNRWIAKHFLHLEHLPHFCLVNILGRKEIFPEYIKVPFTPEEISLRLKELPVNKIQEECRNLATSLGTHPTSKLVVDALLK